MNTNENQMDDDALEVDALMDYVNSKKTAAFSDTAKIQKVNMRNKAKQGNITFVPFPASVNKMPFMFFKKVYELKYYHDKFEGETWRTILDKADYGTLTPEENALYDSVRSKFEYVWNEDLFDFGHIRKTSYSAYYGKIVHTTIDEVKPIASCIIVPSSKMSEKQDESSSLITSMQGGNRLWFQSVVNKNPKDRKGFITLGCNLGPDNKYALSFTYGMNEGFTKPVPDNFEFTKEDIEMFKDLTLEVIGWQRDWDNSRAFNAEVFKDIDAYLLKEITEYEAKWATDQTGNTDAPIVNNNNAADSMIPNQPATPNPIAPNPAPTPAPGDGRITDGLPPPPQS